VFSNKTILKSEFALSLKKLTPARIGIGHAGGRYLTDAQIKFRNDLAISKDAVHKEVSIETLQKMGFLILQTRAKDRKDYLMNTRAGRYLNEESVETLKKQSVKKPQIQLIASDGLSSEAFDRNVPQMWPLLTKKLESEGYQVGTPVFVRWGRVAVMDHVGEITQPEAGLILLGERPGLGISDSLSGYFGYQPCAKRVESDRNVLCNIHALGVPPTEAALMLADALIRVLQLKKSGMNVRFDFN